jgi:uracil DNA glycosylase
VTEPSWSPLVDAEASKSYWKKLETFVQQQWQTVKVFPSKQNIFRSINTVPFDAVRVVILGQVCFAAMAQADIHHAPADNSRRVPRWRSACACELAHRIVPELAQAPPTRETTLRCNLLHSVQDPYHNDGQAEGYCFSVPKDQPVPSSLRNIYKEIVDDVGGVVPRHGHLQSWADQGVLLINTSLTVEVRAPLHRTAERSWRCESALRLVPL